MVPQRLDMGGRQVALAGWGQVRQDKHQRENLLDPLGLMAAAATEAAAVAGSIGLLRQLDAVFVVRVMSRHYDDAAKQLADRIGASPRLTRVSAIGGTSPQLLVNQAAGLIARGELDSVLIAGGETYYPRGGQAGRGADALFQGLRGGHERDDMIGSTEVERRHGLELPIQGFPLFETALWAESGLPLDRYLAQVGEQWSRFSQVAAHHPVAWSQSPRTAEEITQPTPLNRMVAFPYPKFMTSLISVDLGAAVLLLAPDRAATWRPFGSRPVFFRGGAYGEDRQRFLIERSSFTRSEALAEVAGRALRRSGLSLPELSCFDLYSCFPCAVTLGRRALRLEPDEARPLTVTGGLGFFGGPGNNYSLHAIATLAQAIALSEVDHGLTTSVGWFMHKLAAGVYSASPPVSDLSPDDLQDWENRLIGDAPMPSIERAEGEGRIETYTLLYKHDGSINRILLFARDRQERRFTARVSPTDEVCEALVNHCWIGRKVAVRHDDRAELNFVDLTL